MGSPFKVAAGIPAAAGGQEKILLAGDRVGYSQRVAAFCAAAAQYFASIFGGHSLAEAVLVDAAAVGGLERSFHFLI